MIKIRIDFFTELQIGRYILDVFMHLYMFFIFQGIIYKSILFSLYQTPTYQLPALLGKQLLYYSLCVNSNMLIVEIKRFFVFIFCLWTKDVRVEIWRIKILPHCFTQSHLFIPSDYTLVVRCKCEPKNSISSLFTIWKKQRGQRSYRA